MHTYHALLQQLETYNLGFSSSRLATAEKSKAAGAQVFHWASCWPRLSKSGDGRENAAITKATWTFNPGFFSKCCRLAAARHGQ